MGKYVVKWNRSAYLQMVSISTWYRENVALKAASSFISSIHKAIEQISSYPTIGMLDRKRSNARFKYHSVLLHPKYRLIYRISKTTIRIVAIQCNLMNNDNN
jgi:plasmid stabilization system protein ParE